MKAALWGAAAFALLLVVGVLAVFGGSQLAAHSQHGVHPIAQSTRGNGHVQITVPAPSATLTVTAPPPSPAPVPASVVNCGQTESEPGTIVFTCGDGGAGIQGLTWSGWGTPVATASGSFWRNDCVPDCADGTFTYTPGSVTLDDLQAGAYQQIAISAPGTSYDRVTETVP